MERLGYGGHEASALRDARRAIEPIGMSERDCPGPLDRGVGPADQDQFGWQTDARSSAVVVR